MANVVKTLQTRIALKYDSYANWTDEAKGANLVLLKGEIGICAIGDNIADGSAEATTNPTVLFKVGDGVTPFKTLKWASALAADVYGWAKASDVVVDGKTIKFVGGAVDAEGNPTDKVITLNFATPEEVEAITDDLDERIANLEAALGVDTGSENSVSARLTTIEGAITVINGEGAGSIKKAEADAKAYTDEVIGTKAEGETAATGIRKEIADAQSAAITAANTYADGKVTKEDGKSLVLDTEITKLAGVSDGANKVEKSDVNGNIKVDGEEVVVYTHPEKHAIADVDGLQDALDSKLVAADIAELATKEEAQGYADAKDEAIAAAKQAGDDAQDTIDAYKTSNDTALAGVKATAEAAAVKTEVETALAGKADKSVVEAMYTNEQIDTKFADYTTTVAQEAIDAAQDAKIKAIADDYVKAADIASLAGKADKTYVDEELGKKVNTSDYNADKETFALKTDLNAYRTSADQDTIDNEIKGRIDVVEGVLNDKTEGDVTTPGLISRVAVLEAIDHDKLATDASAAAVATVLDGAPEKFDTLKEIAAWIAEENTAADAAALVTRVAALEAIDHDAYIDADATLKSDLEDLIDAIDNHSHANKELLDSYTQTEENLADAVAKKHSHTFVESELNKIADGDVAKWNAEIGAKELAASKTTTAEVKAQIEEYGYATEADLTDAEDRIKAIEDDYLKAADLFIIDCGSATTVIHEAPAAN